jgi:hypothetical protein
VTARLSRDAAFGLLALMLAGAYYAAATVIPQSSLADAVGPQGLPRVYALSLAALALVLIARSRQRAAGNGQGAADVAKSLGLLAIGAAYVVIVSWVGYIAAIALLIGATIAYQARAWRRTDAIVAVGGALLLWILFVVFLGIRQPAGIWSAYR